MKVKYTKPKLTMSPLGWYVSIYYNGKLKRYKAGLNRISDLKQRKKEAKVFIKVMTEELRKGWNPFAPNVKTDYPLCFALEFALNKKKDRIAPKTYLGYRSNLRFIIKAINDLSFDLLNADELKRSHVKMIMERVKKDRNWSPQAYNKGLDYLSALFTELIQWDIVEDEKTIYRIMKKMG